MVRAVRPAPRGRVLFLPRKQRLSAEAFAADYAELRDLALAADGPWSGTVSGVETDAATLTGRLAGTDRLVAVRSAGAGRLGGTGLDTVKQAALDREFTVCARLRVRGLVVTAFRPNGDRLPLGGGRRWSREGGLGLSRDRSGARPSRTT